MLEVAIAGCVVHAVNHPGTPGGGAGADRRGELWVVTCCLGLVSRIERGTTKVSRIATGGISPLDGDQDAVAGSDDAAARDLGLVRNDRVELLVADPGCDGLRRLLALLRSLEETERAEDAVARLDEEVAP